MGRPVPLRKDGVQQKVKKNIFFSALNPQIDRKGEEVSESHKVQSIRAGVEQTIADLKLAKVMEDNKISSVTDMEKVLDCVISLHNFESAVQGG